MTAEIIKVEYNKFLRNINFFLFRINFRSLAAIPAMESASLSVSTGVNSSFLSVTNISFSVSLISPTNKCGKYAKPMSKNTSHPITASGTPSLRAMPKVE